MGPHRIELASCVTLSSSSTQLRSYLSLSSQQHFITEHNLLYDFHLSRYNMMNATLFDWNAGMCARKSLSEYQYKIGCTIWEDSIQLSKQILLLHKSAAFTAVLLLLLQTAPRHLPFRLLFFVHRAFRRSDILIRSFSSRCMTTFFQSSMFWGLSTPKALFPCTSSLLNSVIS